jgi:hypothetical protein
MKEIRLIATVKQNPKIDTAVESQVSKSVRPFDKLSARFYKGEGSGARHTRAALAIR